MSTQTERTTAHAAFVARRAFVEALRVKHGFAATDLDLAGGDTTAFFDELAAYDAADVKPGMTVAQLRDSGHCVIVWTPEEIGEADISDLESVSIERGHSYLEGF